MGPFLLDAARLPANVCVKNSALILLAPLKKIEDDNGLRHLFNPDGKVKVKLAAHGRGIRLFIIAAQEAAQLNTLNFQYNL